ncbi:glycosyltransferase family 2 protein [Oceanimonas sp. NS1]|nr:glycosyltransferase family 2 protein [Oceanimonas sp. NS1]
MSWLSERKNKLSVGIGAIFKNEHNYILKWIAWHLSQGINKLFIYDNNSTDGSQKLLEKLKKIGVINFHTTTVQQGAQIPAYEAILEDYKDELDIIAFIDADEFVIPQNHQLVSDHLRHLFSKKTLSPWV